MVNLLDNAITYGNEQGNILIKLTNNPIPCFTIEDDGPGIADTECKKKSLSDFIVFPGSPGNGCGLGLAIVKEIADRHQMHIDFI